MEEILCAQNSDDVKFGNKSQVQVVPLQNQTAAYKYRPVPLEDRSTEETDSILSTSGPDDLQVRIRSVSNIALKSLPASPMCVKQSKKDERCMSKDGECKLRARNTRGHGRWRVSWEAIFTFLLEVKWRWTFFALFFTYFATWTFFGLIWYGIAWLYGDLEHFGEADWNPCITGIHNFASAFLFSLETQHTTGFGFHEPKDDCTVGLILLGFQSVLGHLFEGLLVGLIFVKMSRAKWRGAKLIFSRNAVICSRDGQPCFMFRVANSQCKTNILETHIRAQIIKKRTTREGEVIHFFEEEFQISGNNAKMGKSFLFWPTTMVHQIDKNSPLYNLSPLDLAFPNENNFEIIIVLEGILESNGQPLQAKTSYLPSEIIWGHRFEELGTNDKSGSSGDRIIDYSKFHATVPVNGKIDFSAVKV